jgi:hypothetical protein
MAKYNRNAGVRARRRWYRNVGGPIESARRGQGNPNDAPTPSSAERRKG